MALSFAGDDAAKQGWLVIRSLSRASVLLSTCSRVNVE